MFHDFLTTPNLNASRSAELSLSLSVAGVWRAASTSAALESDLLPGAPHLITATNSLLLLTHALRQHRSAPDTHITTANAPRSYSTDYLSPRAATSIHTQPAPSIRSLRRRRLPD